MKRLTVAILCCFLVACQTDKPKPVTAKQAAQYNVQTTPAPNWLARWNETQEHIITPEVWLWDHTVGSVKATALDITPTGIIAGQVQIDTQVPLTSGTTSAGQLTITTK